MEIDELIAKYPKIFQDYHGNPGQCNWRGLPDGWIKNVDKNRIIEDYEKANNCA